MTTELISRQGEKRKLPDGWRWVKLGEVAKVQSGYAFKSEWFTEEGIRLLRNANIFQGFIAWDNTVRLPNNRGSEFQAYELSVGDIVLSLDRPVVSKGIKVARISANDVPSLLLQRVGRFQLRDSVDPDYLYAFLNSTIFIAAITQHDQSLGVPHVSPAQVEAVEFPFPPLPEQKRIAAILKEQMEAVERSRQATLAQIEAAQALPAAYLRAVFNSSEAQKWERKRLGDIALQVQNGIYKSAENYGHGHPFLRMYNLQNNSWYLNLDPLAKVSLDERELDIYKLNKGDILLSRVNSFELVGKCAWVGSIAEGYVFENMLIRVRLCDSVDSLFVAQQINSRPIREQIQGIAKRAIGQASINSQDLRSLQIVLPLLREQQRIAANLTEQMAEVESLQQSLKSQLDTINKLPATLLRRAFNGEL
jgi:type I restriction enzyme S subunit